MIKVLCIKCGVTFECMCTCNRTKCTCISCDMKSKSNVSLSYAHMLKFFEDCYPSDLLHIIYVAYTL